MGDPAFLRLWAGSTASGLATWALPFILGLAVLEGTLTAAGLGAALAARTAGFLAAVPIAGALADRRSRRGVVLWSGLAAAGASPLVAVGAAESAVLMAAAAAVVGAGQGACRPAFQALTAEVVAEPRRQEANAALTLSVRVTTLVAPGATALASTVLGTGALLAGTAVLWAVAALLPPRGAAAPAAGPSAAAPGAAPASGPASGRFRLLADLAEGLREARRHPWFVSGLGALTAVIATGYSATGVLLPVVSRDGFGGEAVLAGALTAYTAGALAGAVLIARLRPPSAGWAALAGLALYGFAPLSLLFAVHPAVVIAAYVVAGVGIELFNVPWFTAAQREVEPSKLARVSSLDFLFSYGLAPVGLALIAPAADAFGTAAVLAVCAAVCFAAPAAAALAPGARHFTRPTAPPPEARQGR
ncbi:MFS transporter [Streptomonospora sp. S1-112]|uniref:MFS transporter n=1 Tax=Streptomonospora mangrovi TaxID=2883123 RepID=A0A9X3SLY0_9ACTN|nr:MFS transporter [Streptomonospora mangrovi]MDA0563831.1 MFS transporter [Streptomonospora mangrovi]